MLFRVKYDTGALGKWVQQLAERARSERLRKRQDKARNEMQKNVLLTELLNGRHEELSRLKQISNELRKKSKELRAKSKFLRENPR